jgi:ATP-dependent 26S proteasome regulatory subunit
MEYELRYEQWAIRTGRKYFPTTKTIDKLPPGYYGIASDPSSGIYLQKKDFKSDELFQLPSEELKEIIQDIEKFWKNREVYKKRGFLHKRGILMYGSPGMGKSGIIQLCTKHLVDKMKGIVVNLLTADELLLYEAFIPSFRDVEPERPIIVVIEDIDAITDQDYVTSTLLNVLDGINQIENVFYIATTNYPEKLEERIMNRPSRFDRRFEVEPPNSEVRSSYFKFKLTADEFNKINIKEWVKKTEGMSLAHLKELVVSVFAMGDTFENTIDRLSGLKVKPKIKSKKHVGFN